jgi:hypothetical protein
MRGMSWLIILDLRFNLMYVLQSNPTDAIQPWANTAAGRDARGSIVTAGRPHPHKSIPWANEALPRTHAAC